ncbi:IS1634 family transposase [Hugenholtzia roseola]|uniref:IS1634 family transposase n=1 Tax=Hugenholtzia roseola TaxID=1002 RepID=UPI0004142E1D|nr:hypothetical protein [Hugenholtzia roseola]
MQSVSLQHFYHNLDKLSLYSTELQKLVFQKNKQLQSYELDLVFYDVTTFYFDSEVVVEEALRQKGFSKDGKIGKTQVILGLLLDKNALPLGYGLYAGNQYEGHTLVKKIDKLKQLYNLNKITVVADSGRLNAANCQAVKGAGYDFLLGGRLKNLPQTVKTTLLDKTK